MRSRFRVLGHPAHPMLVMFPVAFLPLLLFLDALTWWLGSDALWTAAFWIAVAGLATTVVAIIPGLVDLSAIRDGTKAHRTAVIHMVVGFAILALFAAAVWARWPGTAMADRFVLATGIDVLGTLAVTAQGWLGGELVYRHHVGVRTPEEGGEPVAMGDDASADAPRTGARGRRGPS